MAYYLSPVFQDAQLASSTGIPLNGGKLYTDVAGTSTPVTVYQDDGGSSSHANPIVLNARGEPSAPIWINGGTPVKFRLHDASDTLIRTIDDVYGVNDPASLSSATSSEWVSIALTPTYISSSSFSVSGNQSATLHVGRRVKIPVSGNTSYGWITASTPSGTPPSNITTITVDTTNSAALDSSISSLSSFEYALLAADNPSTPGQARVLVGSGTNQTVISGGTITQSSASGTEPSVLTSSAAATEVAARITVSSATSGAGLKLGNSNLNKQISMRARSDGGITFYVNQASGGATTSGTQAADLDASGYFNAVRVSENATRTFSRNSAFVSSTQTYTSTSQTMTFAHGLGAKPVSYDAYAVCNTIDNGYAVGDEIKITSLSSAIESVTVSCNATNVYVAIKGGIPATDRTTPSTYAALTANRWDVYVRAWY